MQQICDDLAAEHDALDVVVADLDEGDWSRATPAAGWDIADTIIHLIQADMAASLAVTDPQGFAEAKAAMAAQPSQDNSAAGLSYFVARGDLSGAEVLSRWRSERDRMVDAFRSRGPKDRIPWFGPDMSTLSFATARLMETWAHGQDIADTVQVPWPETGRLRHVCHIGVSTRAWSYLNRGLVAPDGAVRVELAAPDGSTWTWGPGDAADRVTGTALDFCLLTTQRRTRAQTALNADGPLADEWLDQAQAFAGPPTLPARD